LAGLVHYGVTFGVMHAVKVIVACDIFFIGDWPCVTVCDSKGGVKFGMAPYNFIILYI